MAMQTLEKTTSVNTVSSSPLGGGSMKQLPNFFTLLNLIFGCIAIVFILQTGETIVQLDEGGASQVFLPEKIWWGALFIFAAAIIDFLDGFLARMLKAHSAMGEQLDSLSDVVSFGVAPGMILYQLLRISYAQEEGGLNVSLLALFPSFIYTAAVAWRLAKFNISTNQSASFRGVPSPAAGLVIASFPLIIFYQYYSYSFLINKWVLYGIILGLSYLMVSNRKFMAMKFADFSFKNNSVKYSLVLLSLISIVFLKWLAVPLIFILYLLLSAFSKESAVAITHTDKEPIDITV
jgi:CDP-diacylglycerol--serine O-phosphatidyltransferase